MVDDLNFIFTLVCGTPPKKAQECIDRNKIFCQYYGIDYKILPFDRVPNIPIAATANLRRLEISAKEPCVLYTDWDLLLIDIPPLKPEWPCFALYGRQQWDIYFYYNGNKTQLFADFIKFLDHNKWLNIPFAKITNIGAYCHPLKYFFHQKATTIQPRYYHHYSLAMGREGDMFRDKDGKLLPKEKGPKTCT
jgi:hypothetical protein